MAASIQGLSVSITAPSQLSSYLGWDPFGLHPDEVGLFGPPLLQVGSANPSLSLGVFNYFLKVSPTADPGLWQGSPSQRLTSPANTTERGWAFSLLLPNQNVSLGLLVPSAVGFSFCS